MIVRPLTDSGWIHGVIAMMERRAPLFLAAGDLVNDREDQESIDAEIRHAKIITLYHEQKRSGSVDMKAIAKAVGVSRRTVNKQTFSLRNQ